MVQAQRLHDRLTSAVQHALAGVPGLARSSQAVQGAAAAAILSAALLTGVLVLLCCSCRLQLALTLATCSRTLAGY